MLYESLFLAYRRFFPIIPPSPGVQVSTTEDIDQQISRVIADAPTPAGLLLSGGVDSGILAHYMPKGSIAYTFTFNLFDANEVRAARAFTKRGWRQGNLDHRRIRVTRESFLAAIDELITAKKAPIVPHEPMIWLAAKRAKADGLSALVTGQSADGRFGGFPNLYRAAGSPSEFRRAFWRSKIRIRPERILKSPASVDEVLEHYLRGSPVDVKRILTEIGTGGNGFSTPIELAGLTPIGPYRTMSWAPEIDLARISAGEDKYMLRDLFAQLYPRRSSAKKRALGYPGEAFLAGYRPTRPEFRDDIEMRKFSGAYGKRIITIYALERYFHLREIHGWPTPEVTALFG